MYDFVTPIFLEMRFTRVLRGGSNWSAVPPEKLPPPQLWNKLIPGTVFQETICGMTIPNDSLILMGRSLDIVNGVVRDISVVMHV